MTARDTILSAVHAALGPARDARTIADQAALLLDDPDSTRPRLAGATLAEAFIAKATALGTTIDRIPDMAAAPQAVRAYLDAHGLGPRLALQPDPALTALDWSGLDTHADIAPDEPASLCLALWGIAEGGSLVIHSSPTSPILMSFLPLHHIVLLPVAKLLAYLEDYAARLGHDIPRNAVLITGPSGTTDIEGSYVRGAHGPGFVHVIVIGDGHA